MGTSKCANLEEPLKLAKQNTDDYIKTKLTKGTCASSNIYDMLIKIIFSIPSRRFNYLHYQWHYLFTGYGKMQVDKQASKVIVIIH